VGQSLSALISASFQYVSARCRCHSLTEAVYLALLSFLGLISSFHNISPVFGFFYSYFFGAPLLRLKAQPFLLYPNNLGSSSDFFAFFKPFLFREGFFWAFFD